MDLEWLRKRENVSSIEFGTMDVTAVKTARTDTDVQSLKIPRGPGSCPRLRRGESGRLLFPRFGGHSAG